MARAAELDKFSLAAAAHKLRGGEIESTRRLDRPASTAYYTAKLIYLLVK
jgi:hypothetical protein